MKRTRLITVVVAAAALALAGCSSSSSDGPEGSTDAAVGSADAAVGSADTAGGESSEVSSAPAADDTVTDIEADAGSESSGDVAPVDLDPQSVAWFSEFCGITDPFNSFFTALMGSATVGLSGEQVDPAKLVEVRTSLVTAFQGLGDGMTSVGAKLAGMAPPGIDNGAAIAQQVIKGMAAGGPALAQIADKIGQVPTDSAEVFSTQLDTVMGSVDGLEDQLGITDLTVDDSVKAAVAALPACQGSMLLSGAF